MDFWMGAMVGLFAGTAIGVLLTCLMVAARREPDLDPALAMTWVNPEGDGPGTRVSPPGRVSGRNG